MQEAFANDGGETAARNAEICPRVTNGNGNTPIPIDGLANLSYDKFTNRITTAGFEYDAAGNQRRIVKASGTAQKFQYDAANRLVTVYDDYGYTLQSVTYGSSNQRLIVQDGDANSNYRTYYAGDMAEYVETPNSPTVPQWNKTFIYLGARLLATLTPNGSGEYVQYQHPDRLGTRLITNGTDATTQEQVALPYGTALDAESTGATNKRFTSYNRSGMTGLDYAVNRHYDSQQGRFTQVDPIEMSAVSLGDPQSLNMYSYCGNDPINRVDPSGLFFGRLFKKLFQRIVNAFVSAVQAFVLAFLSSGFNLKVALIAGAAEFVKALLSKPTFPVGKTTPGFNPNASAVFGAGTGGLNRYIIYNFTKGAVRVTGNRLNDYLSFYNLVLATLLQPGNACFEYLAGSANIANVSSFVRKQRAKLFDGTLSTITLGQAGLVPTGTLNASIIVRDYFANTKTVAATVLLPGKAYGTLYLGEGFGSATLVHEALHAATGLSDKDLAKRLGLQKTYRDTPGVSRDFDTAQEASEAIQKHLEEKGCN